MQNPRTVPIHRERYPAASPAALSVLTEYRTHRNKNCELVRIKAACSYAARLLSSPLTALLIAEPCDIRRSRMLTFNHFTAGPRNGSSPGQDFRDRACAQRGHHRA